MNTNDKKVNVTVGGLEGIVHLTIKNLLNSVYICIMNNISNVFVCLMEGAKQHWTEHTFIIWTKNTETLENIQIFCFPKMKEIHTSLKLQNSIVT